MDTCERLLIATPLYPPDAGGPATYAHIVEHELPKHGIEVVVVSFSSVRHLPKVVRHIVYFWNILREAKKVDTILALDPVSVGLPACIAAKILRTKFVVKVVGDYAWEQGRQRFGITASLDDFVLQKNIPFPVLLLRSIQYRVTTCATRVLVPSKYLKAILITWGLSEERIHVVYNAVSVEDIARPLDELVPVTHPLIVTVGRLVPWKHIDRIIDAVAQNESRGASATLAVVGDGPLRSALFAHSQKINSIDCKFLGQKNHAETLAAIAAADIFVLNSSYEGLSHVLIEALMLGKVIVATQAGGNPELITDGVSGLLVPVGDTQALAHALKRVSEDASLRTSLETGAREASRAFSIAHMIETTLTALR